MDVNIKVNRKVKLLLQRLQIINQQEEDFRRQIEEKREEVFEDLNNEKICDNMVLYRANVKKKDGKEYPKWSIRIINTELKSNKICYVGGDPCDFESKLNEWLEAKPEHKRIIQDAIKPKVGSRRSRN
jgi:hypothetical protein